MKEKTSKIKSVIQKYGLILSIKKIIKYINTNFLSKINIFAFLAYKVNEKKYSQEIDEILNSQYDRIIIWRSSFGWNVPLFQRPQHISMNFARQNSLVFYEVTKMTDDVKTVKKQEDNLYLVNFNNSGICKLLFSKLKNVKKPKYIQFYSTDYDMSLKELENYIDNGYKIIYEYIDDLNPEISGTNTLPKNQLEKYNYMLQDTENVYVVVTATEIENDIIEKRGNEKYVFACNGVDYDHFQNVDSNYNFEREYTEILNRKKPIVGYYGALANWFDYELIKKLAKERPEYNIVFFGAKYDGAFDNAHLEQYKNIHFMGSRDYNVLPYYAKYFTVCTIPFIINSITNATSPVKLFEYMALNKPIVTTAMFECKKYKSVMIANNYDEFIELIDNAVKMNEKDNKEYFQTLKKEALDNTWKEKVKSIIEMLKEHE